MTIHRTIKTSCCSGLIRTTLYATSVIGLLILVQPQIASAQTIPGTCGLMLNKVVVNNGTGTAQVSDFTLTATATTGTPPGFFSGQSGVSFVVPAGDYVLSEAGPAGYTASDWTCINTVTNAPLLVTGGNTVTIGITDAEVTCTITNTANAPTCASLTVNKVVQNNNGGTAVATDFILDANGPDDQFSNWEFSGPTPLMTSATEPSIPHGIWVISETQLAGYELTSLTCSDANGNPLTVTPGSDGTSGTIDIETDLAVTCTLVNHDIAPQLCVQKVVVGSTVGTDTFSYQINGGTATAFLANGAASCSDQVAGTPISVTEVSAPGFLTTYDNCDFPNGIALGTTQTCTVTNTATAPTIQKTADAASVQSGQPIGFTITVTQGGLAGPLCVLDELPLRPGLAWTIDPAVTGCSIVPLNPSLPNEAQLLTCNLGEVDVAQAVTIHLSGTTTSESTCCDIVNIANLFQSATCENQTPVVPPVASSSADTNVICAEPAVCGNGILETGEQCEPSIPLPPSEVAAGVTCDSATCQLVIPPPPTPVCGNDILEAGEQCEPNLPLPSNVPDGTTCGAVGTANACLFVFPTPPPPPPVCGNGVIDPGEQCETDADCVGLTNSDNPGAWANVCTSAQEAAGKITICHWANGHPHSICVNASAETAHLPHSVPPGHAEDHLGACLEEVKCVQCECEVDRSQEQAATFAPTGSTPTSNPPPAAGGSGGAVSGGCSATGPGSGVGLLPALLLLVSLFALRMTRGVRARK